MKEQTLGDSLRSAAGFSIGLAVIMIVVGVLAIAQPAAAGVGVSVFVGWLMVLGGVIYLAFAFAAQGFGSFIWRVLIGLVYAFGGFYLVSNPGIALASLTFVVAVVLIADGILETIAYFQIRQLSGAGWILFDGIVTFILGAVIIYPWPSSSSWAIGTLVGVSLIVSGVTRLMYSIDVRNILSQPVQH